MRYFAIIAAVCVLASQASALNITEAIKCVSNHMSKSMNASFEEVMERVDNIDGHRKDITANITKALQKVRDEFDEELKQKLSEIDTACEEGSAMQRAKCFIQSRIQMMFAATSAGTNALRKAAAIMTEHAKDFGKGRMDGAKNLAQLVASGLPKLLSAAKSCFENSEPETRNR